MHGLATNNSAQWELRKEGELHVVQLTLSLPARKGELYVYRATNCQSNGRAAPEVFDTAAFMHASQIFSWIKAAVETHVTRGWKLVEMKGQAKEIHEAGYASDRLPPPRTAPAVRFPHQQSVLMMVKTVGELRAQLAGVPDSTKLFAESVAGLQVQILLPQSGNYLQTMRVGIADPAMERRIAAERKAVANQPATAT